MRSQVASPFNSGRIPGKSATNLSRSAAGSAWIAASSSCTVLMVEEA